MKSHTHIYVCEHTVKLRYPNLEESKHSPDIERSQFLPFMLTAAESLC